MTRQRNIDHVLEAWFLEGPSEMQDRLFDAVFDRIERVPQRRLARLKLRFAEMNPTMRWIAAAAVAIVVAGIGLAAFGPSADNGRFGASPSASPGVSPGASGSAGAQLPSELRARWMSGTRSVPGMNPLVGTTMLFTNDTFVLTPSNPVSTHLLGSSASAVGDGKLRFELTSGGLCTLGDVGLYSWSLSASGRTLTVTADSDACATRLAAVPGVWWRQGCKDPEPSAGCLGDLDAGVHSSQYFDPFVPANGNWQPRFGALGYEVPDGWENSADWPGEFTFKGQTSTDDSGIHLWSDVAIASAAVSCPETPQPGVGRTVAAMTTWLTALPGIASTDPAAVTIGGLPGTTLDVSMDPTWKQPCPFSQGKPYRALFSSPDGSGFHWGVDSQGRMRLYLLDLGDGRTLLIDIEAPSKASYDKLIDGATAIVESFTFKR